MIINIQELKRQINEFDLLNSSRKHKDRFTFIRCYYYYRLRQKQDSQLTYQKIGKLFKKNHSTVMSAVRKFEAQYYYQDFQDVIQEFKPIIDKIFEDGIQKKGIDSGN